MKAVILAAGKGTRLRPLTNTVPKCLVEVCGKPILQYEMEALEHAGVEHCVVVVGHLGESVTNRVGPQFGRMSVSYVANQDYWRTNNLYSLWLARRQLDDDTVLLDGDLLFEPALIDDLVRLRYEDVAVVDVFQPFMNGSVILAEDGLATSLVLGAEQSPDFCYDRALKTVNIYKLSQSTLRDCFLPRLDWWVAQGRTDQFYEAALAGLIDDGDVQLGVHLAGRRLWMEVDTREDLRNAEKLLATEQFHEVNSHVAD